MHRILVLGALLAPAVARAESAAPPPREAVDLLIVADVEREVIAPAIPALVDRLLEQFPEWEAALALHVGVIGRDDGALREVATADCAAAPAGRYVEYEQDAWNGDGQNFDGALADAIACLVGGERLAQPLAAIRRALDGTVADNDGFRRPGSTLAILIVTDGEDCSTDGAPLDAFACAADAWECTPPIDGTPQAHTCVVDDTPATLDAVAAHVDFAATLTGDAWQVPVGLIRGAREPVAVVEGPAIAPSCAAATPALRLDAYATSFPHASVGDLCGGIDADDLAAFAAQVRAATFPRPPDGEWPPRDGGVPPLVDGATDPSLDDGPSGCGCAATTPAGAAPIALFLVLGLALLARRP